MSEWAADGKLPTFHLNSAEEYPPMDISSLCSRNYFYSEHPTLEMAFSRLESAQATPIHKIRRGSDLRSLDRSEQNLLLSFVTTQRLRTRLMRMEIRDSGEDFFREAVQKDFKEWGVDPDEEEELVENLINNGVRNTHNHLLIQGVLGAITLQDIDATLFHVRSDTELILSDAPIVFDNPYFKDETGQVYAGLANRGLQIYCPLSPNKLLLLYDPECYEVKRDDRWNSAITTDEVHQLNLLQTLNANASVFYSSPGQAERMQGLLDEAYEYDRSETVTSEVETEEGHRFEYSYQPGHQLFDLSPDIGVIEEKPGARYGDQRTTDLVDFQRGLAYRIESSVETREMAVVKAVFFFLNYIEGLDTS